MQKRCAHQTAGRARLLNNVGGRLNRERDLKAITEKDYGAKERARRFHCDVVILSRLPVAVRVRLVIPTSDLIAFAIHHENHANGSESGRKNED